MSDLPYLSHGRSQFSYWDATPNPPHAMVGFYWARVRGQFDAFAASPSAESVERLVDATTEMGLAAWACLSQSDFKLAEAGVLALATQMGPLHEWSSSPSLKPWVANLNERVETYFFAEMNGLMAMALSGPSATDELIAVVGEAESGVGQMRAYEATPEALV